MIPAFDPAVVLAAALSLTLIFGAAGIAKLVNLYAFEDVVRNFRVLPRWVVRPFARLLPVVQLTVAAGLVCPPSRPLAAALAVVLLLMFVVAIVVILRRGRRSVDCGCFGSAMRERLSWELVVRNAGLAIVALLAAGPGFPARPLHWLDLVTAIGGALMLAMMYATAGYLRSNRFDTPGIRHEHA